MDMLVGVAVTVSMLASIAAAVFAFLAARGARDAQFSDVVRKENEIGREAAEGHALRLRQEIGESLRAGSKANDEAIATIRLKLDGDIEKMRDEATVSRETLRSQIAQRLDESAKAHSTAAKELREEMASSLKRLGDSTADYLRQIGDQQKERLETLASALKSLTEKSERGQEALRQSVEQRLEMIRDANEKKLEQMRQTVDEKLQSTLEQRLGDSFNIVVEHLKKVHEGLGEMQTLASGVGDLKKVLSNVAVRGTFGEFQLGTLLEQFLSTEQFVRNATVKDGSAERVEFAVKLPGRGTDGEVLLPIDCKFPQEDYLRLISAAEHGDASAVAAASEALERTVKLCAKTIHDKYINPPRTTEFAILFLPTEGLYAEVLRKPALFEQLQREFHVTITGPVTLTALLNALQMGFRTLAIEKRSSEVWELLSAVRTEFGKYNKVVERLRKNLSTAANSVEDLGKRTRIMGHKLNEVQSLDGAASQELLGLAALDHPVDEDEDEAVAAE